MEETASEREEACGRAWYELSAESAPNHGVVIEEQRSKRERERELEKRARVSSMTLTHWKRQRKVSASAQ
jgi:hypothetical protein